MDVAGMVVEAQLHALRVQPAHELLRLRYQRTPVVAPLPAIVVPGEIEHQRVEWNVVPAHARDLCHQVLLVVALELGLLRLRRAGEIFEVQIRDPGPEDEARNHGNGSTELRVLRQYAAVVAAVDEEIPVLAERLRTRL